MRTHVLGIKEFASRRFRGQGGEGQRRNKALGSSRENGRHVDASISKAAKDLNGFIGGNTPADA
jgi:hypothetical protein